MFNSELLKLKRKHGDKNINTIYYGCYYVDQDVPVMSSKSLYLFKDQLVEYSKEGKTYKPNPELRRLLKAYYDKRCANNVNMKQDVKIDFHIPYIVCEGKVCNAKLSNLDFPKGKTITIRNFNCDTYIRALFVKYLRENIEIASLEDFVYELKLRGYKIISVNRDKEIFEITFQT